MIYIEMPFAFPEETIEAVQESELDIGLRPEPELILGRINNGKGLYFEAKGDSFGPESSNAKQARGHLLATGPAFGEVLKPLASGLLCYVVPDDKRGPMSESLAALARELKDQGLPAGTYSCHGLAIKDRTLLYRWDDAFRFHTGIKEDEVSVIEDLEDDTDPSPLILVFSDEDCHNPEMRDFYRRVVIEQVRACLLCDLQAVVVGDEYRVNPDDLMIKVSDGVFNYLGGERQKRLRRLIRENVFKRIHDYWKDKQSGIGLNWNQLTIQWDTPAEKDDFLNWLEDRRTKFNANKPPAEEPTLFDTPRWPYTEEE